MNAPDARPFDVGRMRRQLERTGAEVARLKAQQQASDRETWLASLTPEHRKRHTPNWLGLTPGCFECGGRRLADAARRASITLKHEAEPYRVLRDGVTRFGWQCLTCGRDEVVPRSGRDEWQIDVATRLAAAHKRNPVGAVPVAGRGEGT